MAQPLENSRSHLAYQGEYSFLKPEPPLSSFIEMIWYASGPVGAARREKILPTGTTELVIRLSDDRFTIYESSDLDTGRYFPGAMINGIHTRSFAIQADQQDAVIGAHFHPGGFFPFYKRSATDLCDQQVSLEDLWGASGRDLRARILETPTPIARMRLLEQALLSEIKQNFCRRPMVTAAMGKLNADPTVSVTAMAEAFGYSQRRFIQLFKDEVGMPPKLYARLQRFQKIIYYLQPRAVVDWCDVALTAGYHDQAHFIREFREFTGLSPTQYMRLKGPHLFHVPL